MKISSLWNSYYSLLFYMVLWLLSGGLGKLGTKKAIMRTIQDAVSWHIYASHGQSGLKSVSK